LLSQSLFVLNQANSFFRQDGLYSVANHLNNAVKMLLLQDLNLFFWKISKKTEILSFSPPLLRTAMRIYSCVCAESSFKSRF